MEHWGTCPLDFQLFDFSGHFRPFMGNYGLNTAMSQDTAKAVLVMRSIV